MFQGRYKSILVEREAYLLELCRYTVLNPVRAGLAVRAGEWRWSSYPVTADLRRTAPAWLARAAVLDLFGGSGRRYRRVSVRSGRGISAGVSIRPGRF